MGDSIAAGTSTAPGPTCAAGLVYEYVGGVLVDRATTEFSSITSVGAGTIWKQFAIDVNASTGKKVVIIAKGLSGAEVFPNGGTDTHWAPNYDNAGSFVSAGTGSVLYNNAKTDVTNCLAYLGKSSLDGVLQVVGVNDARGGATVANIQLGFESLMDKINSDFPGVPIFAASIGRDETSIMGGKKQSVKRIQWILANARSYYHLAANLINLYEWDAATYYNADNLHLTQTGNNLAGTIFARYFLSTESDKDVRQVLNAFKTARTTAHAAAWKAFVQNLKSAGTWTALESFIPAVGAAVEDVLVDIKYLGVGHNYGFTFSANSHIAISSGTAQRGYFVYPSIGWVNAGQTDFLKGVRVKVNNTAAGTLGYLFGVTVSAPSSRSIFVAQNASSQIVYACSDGTGSTYTGVTKFQNDELVTIGRNGTTKLLYRGGTQVSTAAVAASGGLIDQVSYDGCRSLDGTPNGFLNSQIEASYEAAYTGFNVSTFNTELNTLLTALRIP